MYNFWFELLFVSGSDRW